MSETYKFRISVIDRGRTIDYGVHVGTRAEAIAMCEGIQPSTSYKSVVQAWIESPVMTPVEPWVVLGPHMPPPESPLMSCRVCSGAMSGPMLDLALRDLAQGVCGPECREKELKQHFACCEKATPKACGCAYAFKCEEHGETHVGSHD
jgi:hypothetical protein